MRERSTPIWPEGLTSSDDQDSRKIPVGSLCRHTHMHTQTHTLTHIEMQDSIVGADAPVWLSCTPWLYQRDVFLKAE